MTIAVLGPDAARNAVSYAGEEGNLYTADRAEIMLDALAQNAIAAVTLVPPNFRVLGLFWSHAALGASTGLDFGYAPRDGADAGDDNALLTIADTHLAGTGFAAVVPFVIAKEAYVTVKQTGVGTASGKVTAHLVGVYLGA